MISNLAAIQLDKQLEELKGIVLKQSKLIKDIKKENTSLLQRVEILEKNV
jgi:hypothetical protein